MWKLHASQFVRKQMGDHSRSVVSQYLGFFYVIEVLYSKFLLYMNWVSLIFYFPFVLFRLTSTVISGCILGFLMASFPVKFY